MSREPFIERRQHKRFTMCEGAFAFLQPPSNKVGQIIDISLSGFSFHYFSTNGVIPDSQKVNLLSAEGILLENIPCLTVNDHILPNQQSLSKITMRRRSIKFGPLSQEHLDHLQNIIYNHCLRETEHMM